MIICYVMKLELTDEMEIHKSFIRPTLLIGGKNEDRLQFIRKKKNQLTTEAATNLRNQILFFSVVHKFRSCSRFPVILFN